MQRGWSLIMNQQTFRVALGKAIAPIMRATGFRFDKSYRHAESGWKSWVYACVDVIGANFAAGMTEES